MFGRKAENTQYSRLEQFDGIDDSEASNSSSEPVPEPVHRRRSRPLYICFGIAIVAVLLLTVLVATGAIPSGVPSEPEPSEDEEEVDEIGTKYYEWNTVTPFPSFSREEADQASLEELCAQFPKHKLWDVQPVLKTGHGAMERVRQSLLSTSACLDNLLIFSDLDEDFEGHHVVDVIADIPFDMLSDPGIADQMQPYLDLKALAANGTLNDNHMSRIEGWRTDKFKFLTEISRAWRMAPDKRWYVFYEGDTYIVWDTVFRLVQNFNADQPHYFGSPSPGRDGVWFGNGGPGYILSREAMRRLVMDDWSQKTGEWLGSKLQQKYWKDTLGDCCGDSVLGWVLHQVGVDLKGLWPMFNPHPLQGVPFSDLYWCEPVVSMHKSDLDAEKEFWRYEWAGRSVDPQRPILWRDVATSFWNITSYTEVRQDWDNGGWDTSPAGEDDPNQPHESVENCAIACERSDSCFQWTYHLKRCSHVRSIRVGRAREPEVDKDHEEETWSEEDKRFIAGWNIKKIQKWVDERPCKQVKWVRPSTSRIF